jgi:hypothetical protein
MNEADRIAAARAATDRQAQRRAAQDERTSRVEEIRGLEAKAGELIPQVLKAMADRGYPGIEEVTAGHRSALGGLLTGSRTITRGGYRVVKYVRGESHYGPEHPAYIHLLSDGSLGGFGTSLPLAEYVRRVMVSQRLIKSDEIYVHYDTSLQCLRDIVEGLAARLETGGIYYRPPRGEGCRISE